MIPYQFNLILTIFILYYKLMKMKYSNMTHKVTFIIIDVINILLKMIQI